MAVSSEKLKAAVRETVRDTASRLVQQVVQKLPTSEPPGPSCPASSGEAVFRSTIPFAAETQADALVIACNSFLYLHQTLEFVQKGLGVDQYDLVAVPGGVQWLALPEVLPKHSRVARWAVEFLVRKHSLRRVIGIAHQGCSAYADDGTLASLAHLATGKSVREHQFEHLRRAGQDLAAALRVGVELFYASVDATGAVVFHRLEPETKGVA
jgi:hypothetical protein